MDRDRIGLIVNRRGVSMSTSREQAISALKTLVAGVGMSLTEDDLEILERNSEEANEYNNRLSEIYKAMFYGFFHCAAKGLVLVPENRVTEKFRRPIKDNYPEANEVFLKFAKTYWTLRVLTMDLMKNDEEWIGAHLLLKLEQDIGPVFFPFPGAVTIAPSIREKTQREIIQKSGAKIDLEEFIRGNPILIRDRKQRSGCLGTALLLLLCFTLICCIALFLVVNY